MAAGNARLKRQVIPHIEARDQVELLKNQTKPVAPQRRETGIAEFRNRDAGKPDLAAVGAIKSRDQMQQRAFAAAGFAGQRHALAGPTLKFTPRNTAMCSPAER